METREAFGPNLRRRRLRRGVTLESIARVTNVPVPLWEAFEDNDLYGWPSGVLARSFVHEYARLIGEDPEETVNQFCRLFPQADRRRRHVLHNVATVIDHRPVWIEEVPLREERRQDQREARLQARQLLDTRRKERLAQGLVDAAIVAIITAVSVSLRAAPIISVGIAVGIGYYTVSEIAGWSIGSVVTERLRAASNHVDRSSVRESVHL
jgi:transcriptional regulator with XRE-family HTH domain